MGGGDQGPRPSILCVSLDRLHVTLDVKSPRRDPTFEFRLKFGPLFGHAHGIVSFVVQQQGGGLDEALHQEDFFHGRLPRFQGVPQVLP